MKLDYLRSVVISDINCKKNSVLVFYIGLDVALYKSFAKATPVCKVYYGIACSCSFGPRGEHHHQGLHGVFKKSQQVYFKTVSVSSFFLLNCSSCLFPFCSLSPD